MFGCVCFVHDHRPGIGKLDPRATKCIFVGYASRKKGYMCWNPVDKKLFVSMDVTFRESEPYYKKEGDLEKFLDEFTPVLESDRREGESGGNGGINEKEAIVGSIPHPTVVSPERPAATREMQVYQRSYPCPSPIVVLSPGRPDMSKELHVYKR